MSTEGTPFAAEAEKEPLGAIGAAPVDDLVPGAAAHAPASAEKEPFGGTGTDLRDAFATGMAGLLLTDAEKEPFAGATAVFCDGSALGVFSVDASTELCTVRTFFGPVDST